jgi:hypothetical protein
LKKSRIPFLVIQTIFEKIPDSQGLSPFPGIRHAFYADVSAIPDEANHRPVRFRRVFQVEPIRLEKRSLSGAFRNGVCKSLSNERFDSRPYGRISMIFTGKRIFNPVLKKLHSNFHDK